jgi:SAM-dependent methyltransferase
MDETRCAPSAELEAQFGAIDIYLFDQILKGRFDDRPRLLDAGCGGGRNLPFFLTRGFDVFAIDSEPAAVSAVRSLARRLAPSLSPDNIQSGRIEAMPWADGQMDVVVSSAVLHFARDEQQFGEMIREMWRVLAPRGFFFARLASSIGLESRLRSTSGWMQLPDGTERYVVDEAMLLDWTRRLHAIQAEPLKTTIVQGQRAMTTWCLEKRSGGNLGT